MAGFSFRIDRGGHAPVSIKDGPAYVGARPPAIIDVGYRFLYLGDAHTGSIVGSRCPDARPAPRGRHGTGNSRRLAVGHPLTTRYARAADWRPGTTE